MLKFGDQSAAQCAACAAASTAGSCADQPVVPITLNEEWNVISRTILPIVSQKDVFPGSGSQSGIYRNKHLCIFFFCNRIWRARG